MLKTVETLWMRDMIAPDSVLPRWPGGKVQSLPDKTFQGFTLPYGPFQCGLRPENCLLKMQTNLIYSV